MEKYLKLTWIIINSLSYLFMLIGLIYDFILILKGQISNPVYPIVYFIICFIYFIFSILDFYFIEIIKKLICVIPELDEKPKRINRQSLNEEARLKQS